MFFFSFFCVFFVFSGIFNLAFGDSPCITGPADGLITLLIRFHTQVYRGGGITDTRVTSPCLGSIAVLLGAPMRSTLKPSTYSFSLVQGGCIPCHRPARGGVPRGAATSGTSLVEMPLATISAPRIPLRCRKRLASVLRVRSLICCRYSHCWSSD